MTAQIRWSILAAALLVVGLSGCQPSVNSVTVTPGGDNLANVQANISSAPAASMGTPVLRVAALPGNPPVFRDVAGGFTQINGAVYQKDGLALPAGQFRVEVVQPYTPLFTSAVQNISKTQDFTVSVPPGCFFFDGNLAGWTAEGFFEIQTPPTGPETNVPLCSGQTPKIADNGKNFPTIPASPFPDNFRSLATPLDPINNACFSQPAPTPQTGFVAMDLVSPDLTTVPGWTTANGFELQAKGAVLGDPNHPLQIQLLLVNPAGAFFRLEDAQHRPQFTTLGADFAPASFALAGTPLKQIRVRLFVPRVTGSGEGLEVDIDRVCPKTAS
jgi:hypothetical protein